MSTSNSFLHDSATGAINQPTIDQSQPIGSIGASASLRENVEAAMTNYFKHLDGQSVSDVYQMVLSEVEAPLLEHKDQFFNCAFISIGQEIQGDH